jgi:penicillin-binding protein 2
VRIVSQSRRHYPHYTLAAHVLGHLGRTDARQLAGPRDAHHPDDPVGQLGVERQYEPWLQGRRGLVIDTIRRDGQLVSSIRKQQPRPGLDLVLSLDLRVQRTAEALLESACQRRTSLAGDVPTEAGGAAVVLDVHSGAILAMASWPPFDPNWFSRSPAVAGGPAQGELAALLTDRRRPLFDRATRMAIPPGSVFKVVTAAALLEQQGFDPDSHLHCRGYFKSPGQHRCAIFTRSGLGHGDVALSDALCQSCNVYFFQHASEIGPLAIVDWARQFGFGRRTGIDLPSEAAGHVPQPDAPGEAWRTGDTLALAIGQGASTATPLQVARMMAAVANGGWLVTPHVVHDLGLPSAPGADPGRSDSDMGGDLPELEIPPPRRIDALHEETLRRLRQSLVRVVADAEGTAHGTLYLEALPMAAKTGTAESGGGREDHAWLAGYAPAGSPKVAFVVVLEHAGGGGIAAGPVARRLVERMQQLGYFGRAAE